MGIASLRKTPIIVLVEGFSSFATVFRSESLTLTKDVTLGPDPRWSKLPTERRSVLLTLERIYFLSCFLILIIIKIDDVKVAFRSRLI